VRPAYRWIPPRCRRRCRARHRPGPDGAFVCRRLPARAACGD